MASKWVPGRPVATAADVTAWKAWKKESKLAAQRQRRAKCPRIDYSPNKDAHTLILSLVGNWAGGDYSSVIDRLILESAGAPE